MSSVRCVCGNKVIDIDDLMFSEAGFETLVFRCGNEFCGLGKIAEVTIFEKKVYVKFSPMFSDYNLILMGRDDMQKSLRRLACKIIEGLGVGKGLKRRIQIR